MSVAEDDGERQYATVAVFHRAQTVNVQEKMTEPDNSDCQTMMQQGQMCWDETWVVTATLVVQ